MMAKDKVAESRGFQFKVAEHRQVSRFLANAVQREYKNCKKQTWHQYSENYICSMPPLSVLLFFIIEHNVLVVLAFVTKIC